MSGLQIFLFCLASFFLGVALTVKIIFVMAQRRQESDDSEGCFCNLLTMIPLTFAAALFAAGVME